MSAANNDSKDEKIQDGEKHAVKSSDDLISLLAHLFADEKNAKPEGPLRPLEEIVCVFGCQGSGKSIYIAQNYEIGKNTDDIIDIYQYQISNAYPNIAGMPSHMLQTRLSYALMEMDVFDAIQRARHEGSATGRLVLEGTFMRSARRVPLLQTIKNAIDPKCEITCIWIDDPKQHSRFGSYNAQPLFDVPTCDEGFTRIVLREKAKSEITDEKELSRMQRKVEMQKDRDRITEKDMLGYQSLAENAGRAMHKSLVGERDEDGRLRDRKHIHAGSDEREIRFQQREIKLVKKRGADDTGRASIE